MKKTVLFLLIFGQIAMLQSCFTLEPNELALKQVRGKLIGETLKPGRYSYNPINTKIITYDMRVQSYTETNQYATYDGLEITADMNLLYHIKPESVKDVFLKFGTNYEKRLISSNFRSIVQEVYIKYKANDLVIQKEVLELEIIKRLKTSMEPFGFDVDNVLIRDLDMPIEVLQAIKDKVKAEQVAKLKQIEIENERRALDFELEKQRKEADFSIEKEKKEAERLQIEAEAIKKYQFTINETLTDKLLQYKSIEISKGLVTSVNAKVIITDGKSPIMVNAANDNAAALSAIRPRQ